ncbi:MAG: hypothetical protein ACRDBG_11080 [Waterburya sp.]
MQTIETFVCCLASAAAKLVAFFLAAAATNLFERDILMSLFSPIGLLKVSSIMLVGLVRGIGVR